MASWSRGLVLQLRPNAVFCPLKAACKELRERHNEYGQEWRGGKGGGRRGWMNKCSVINIDGGGSSLAL